MKEMNRREFLTLTGASVALLALAACGSTPSTPAAPAGSKEAELVAAINKVWKEKFDAGLVDHEQLTLNQDAVGGINRNGIGANHVQQIVRVNGVALLKAVEQLHDQHNRQQ